MDPGILEAVIRIGFPLVLLLGAWGIGGAIERHHYRSIQDREKRTRRFPVVTFQTVPEGWEVRDATMVSANVVVSVDYFKRFLAGLRVIFGGRIATYETLLDRARREAMLRLKERAFDAGYGAIINVRLETSRMASARRNGEGTAGVEVLAFGTALKLAR